MTVIRVRFVPPGSTDPVAGHITFTARHVDGPRPVVDGRDVILGAPQRFEVTTEGAEIDLRPTQNGWYYAVQGVAGDHRFSMFVEVPTTGPRVFEELRRFDPKGGVAYAPDPVWWAQVDHLRDLSVADTARAEAAADAAELSASEANSSAWLSGFRRDQSEEARDEARAARDETLAHGITVDTSAGTKVSIGGHVVSYDSGARRLDSAVIGGNGWTNGEVHLVRTGNVVTVNAENFNRASAGEGWVTLFVLPAGFRPTGTRRAWVTTFRGRPIQVWADGRFQINAPVALSDYGGLTFIDVTDPPNTLPGTPA